MKTKVKVNAKINLTLHVGDKNEGYHTLCSVVSSVNLTDDITLKKRRDNLIKVEMKNCPDIIIDNNALKAAELFIKKFGVNGVDILIKKGIPLSGGLGGSSADIAGVLLAMKKLYSINESVEDIADKLGSDAKYMLKGGYAKLEGRGEKIEFFNSSVKLHFILIINDKGINTAECFARFDERKETFSDATETCISALKNGDIDLLSKNIGNDLYPSAVSILPELENTEKILRSLKPMCVFMTGSGSSMLALFKSKKECVNAKKLLNGLNFRIIETV